MSRDFYDFQIFWSNYNLDLFYVLMDNFLSLFFSLSNPYKNLNMDHIMKTHFFYEMNYDLKGHGRSHNDYFKNIVVRKVILH